MEQNRRKEKIEFIWRVASAHTIAYFFAGILALVFLNYKEQFATDFMSLIMRSVDSPLVSLGPGLQIFRGIIIALVLLPFKDLLITKKGWLRLSLLILGLSYLSTIGPTFGSFEGYIYTKAPLQYHLLGIPETLIYISLFSSIFAGWYRRPNKVWEASSIALIVFIALMSLMGFLSALGVIKD